MLTRALPILDRRPPPPRQVQTARTWRHFRRDEYWRKIPAFAEVDAQKFASAKWQEQHAVTNTTKLHAMIGALVDDAFLKDAAAGFERAPMAVRLSPYLLSLIDWSQPVTDPIRRQFLPLASQLEEDHPFSCFDSTSEVADSPVPGVTHRYFDRVLFLTTNICPVYCRFCTRSYAVGADTASNEKIDLAVDRARWEQAIRYIAENDQIEDVVVSGGDCYRLKAEQIAYLGGALLAIPHVRRIRFATKGIAVLPMKITSEPPWTDAIVEVARAARAAAKEAVIHTHFNHPNEITGYSLDACNLLYTRGVTVRNLTVMQRGVNDDAETQLELNRRLTYMNVRPYYTYVCDHVKGIEDLRVPLESAIATEKYVRGASSGPFTPLYVVDPPGGCGKRDLHSYEHYDRQTGIAVFAAPSVKPGRPFLYGDPISTLTPSARADWADPDRRREMIADAIFAAGFDPE